ncbi:restriction endonuclease subunit S [Vibrio splendidus]
MSQVIPESWVNTELQEVLDAIVGGGTPSKTISSYFQGDIPWMSVKDMNKSVLNDTVDHITQEAVDNSSTNIIPAGVPIVATRMSLGKIVTASFDSAINQDLKALFVNKNIDKHYLVYWYRSLSQLIESLGTGTTVKGIRLEVLRSLKFPLPPLAEQKIIADKLDELLAQVESTKVRLDAIPAILKSFRQSVLAAAVSGKLTEEWRGDAQSKEHAVLKVQEYKKSWIEKNTDHNEVSRVKKRHKAFLRESLNSSELPNSWSWAKLEDSVLMIVDCHNKTAPYVERGISLIRTSNIRDGKFVWENLRYVNQDTFAYWSKRCTPESGDIIFTREAPMGEAAIIPADTKMCLGQRTMLIRPVESCVSAKYLLMAIMDPMFKKRSEEFAVGTGVKHYRVGDVSNLLVPVPPTKEQTEIVRRVEELFAFADKVEAQVNEAQAKVNNLTQSILAKAFRGELTADWRAANPELITGKNSAKTLLEHIKAEREALALASKAAKKKPSKKIRAKKVVAKESHNTSINRNLSPVQSLIADGVAHNPQDIFNKLTPDLSLTEVFNEISELLRDNKIEEKTVDGITGFFIK